MTDLIPPPEPLPDITWAVYHVVPTGALAQNVVIVLEYQGEYRKLEVVGMPAGNDPEAFVQQEFINVEVAWDAATPLDAEAVARYQAERDAKAVGDELLPAIDEELAWLEGHTPAQTVDEALALVNRLAQENARMLKLLRWQMVRDQGTA